MFCLYFNWVNRINDVWPIAEICDWQTNEWKVQLLYTHHIDSNHHLLSPGSKVIKFLSDHKLSDYSKFVKISNSPIYITRSIDKELLKILLSQRLVSAKSQNSSELIGWFWEFYLPQPIGNLEVEFEIGDKFNNDGKLTWSPQLLIIGMLISSTNTVIFLPAGGPYVVPIRLSTSPSMVRWNINGVVALEKLKLLNRWSSGSYFPQNPWIITVFAVPWSREIIELVLGFKLAPTINSDFQWTSEHQTQAGTQVEINGLGKPAG